MENAKNKNKDLEGRVDKLEETIIGDPDYNIPGVLSDIKEIKATQTKMRERHFKLTVITGTISAWLGMSVKPIAIKILAILGLMK